MSQDRKPDFAEGTVVDPDLSRERLKVSMVAPDTGIYLRIEEGNGKGRIFTLSTGGVYLIGREGADIVLDDEKVSRKHAELGLYGPEAHVLRDLASTNGSLRNDRRVGEKTKLLNGDLLRFGDTVLRFSVVEQSIPVSVS